MRTFLFLLGVLLPVTAAQAKLQPVTLTGEPIAFVGRAWSGAIEVSDPAVEIVHVELPQEMQATDGKLHWTPSAAHIGPQKIHVTLKEQGAQRLVVLSLVVAYPSLVLPDQPTEMVFTPNGKLAVLTNGRPAAGSDADGPPLNRLRHYQMHRDQQREPPDHTTLALVDLQADKVLAVKKQSAAVVLGPVTDDYVVVLRAQPSARCEFLKTKDLEPLKTINNDSPIREVILCGKFLLLATNKVVEIYNAQTLQLLKRLPCDSERFEELPAKAAGAGFSLLGIHFDEALKPRLIAENYRFASLPSVTEEERDEDAREWRRRYEDRDIDRRYFRPQAQDGRELAGETVIEPDGVIVDAVLRELKSNDPRPREQEIITVELNVQTRGAALGGQLLWRMALARNSLVESDRLLLTTAAHTAYVAYDSRLYRWAIPRGGMLSAASAAPTPPIEFVPRQSALSASGTGKTTLTHEVRNGTKPYRFSLPRPRPGITLDETTGVITLDENVLAHAALVDFKRDLGQGHFETMKQNFEQQDEAARQFAADFLGVKLAGHPFAIPIRIEVHDARGQTSRLNYFVLATLPPAVLEAMYKVYPEEQQARREAEEAKHRRRNAEENSPGLRYLYQRLDEYEQRLDVIDGQLQRVVELLQKKAAAKKP